MASLNRVSLIGNLGTDPELRHTGAGTPMVTLSVATTESRTNAEGERSDRTEWHRVVVWGKQAESCARFLSKGKSVYIDGRIQTRSWEDKQGGKRFTTEIVASNVQFLGARGEAHADVAEEPQHVKRASGDGLSYAGGGGRGGGGRKDFAPTTDEGGDFDEGVPF